SAMKAENSNTKRLSISTFLVTRSPEDFLSPAVAAGLDCGLAILSSAFTMHLRPRGLGLVRKLPLTRGPYCRAWSLNLLPAPPDAAPAREIQIQITPPVSRWVSSSSFFRCHDRLAN